MPPKPPSPPASAPQEILPLRGPGRCRLQQLLSAMAGGEAKPGLPLPSPRHVPQQECRAGGGGDNAKADGVPGAWMFPAAAEAACPGLPAASPAAAPARTLGRVSGGVNPCSSAGFSPASGWLRIRPPLKSVPCSNVSGVTQECAVGTSKVPYSHRQHASVCSCVALRAAQPGWAVFLPSPGLISVPVSHPRAAGVLRDTSSRSLV